MRMTFHFLTFTFALGIVLNMACSQGASERLGQTVAVIKNSSVSNVLVAELVFYAGQPLAIYYDDSDASLYAARGDGTTWRVELIAAGEGDARVPSHYMAAVSDENGHIHVVYRDNASGNIRYVFGQPGSWNVEEPLPNGEDRGAGLDIAVDLAGNPWIAYRNDSTQGLEVAYRDQQNWRVEVVDGDGNAGFWPAIDRDLGGRMLVGYHSGSDRSLRLAEFRSAGDWLIREVEAPEEGVAGRWLSLAVRPGRSQDLSLTFPRLLYLFEQEAKMTLHFAQPTGDDKWQITSVEPLLFGGSDNCLAVGNNGQVWASYLDAVALDLKVARLVGSRWRASVVDSVGAAGFWSDCLLDEQGRFHVIYTARDEESAELRYQVLDAGF